MAKKKVLTTTKTTEEYIEGSICINNGHDFDEISPFEGFNWDAVYAYCKRCGKVITLVPKATEPYPESPEIADQRP